MEGWLGPRSDALISALSAQPSLHPGQSSSQGPLIGFSPPRYQQRSLPPQLSLWDGLHSQTPPPPLQPPKQTVTSRS